MNPDQYAKLKKLIEAKRRIAMNEGWGANDGGYTLEEVIAYLLDAIWDDDAWVPSV